MDFPWNRDAVISDAGELAGVDSARRFVADQRQLGVSRLAPELERDMTPFMAEMEKEFGAPTSLEDFERKAQMFNYVQHRAVFEGMNAHLWAPNTGRMLWMTQPAWPSSTWQILSSDYDTQASFYAVKKASEMVHVQLDPSNYIVEVANSLPDTKAGLTAHARVYSLENKLLAEHEEKKDAPTGTTEFFTLDLAPFLKENVALVKLELRDSSGKLMSDNFYWMGGRARITGS